MAVSELIKSISYDQDELLQWIISLYVEAGRFEVDPTFWFITKSCGILAYSFSSPGTASP